MASSLELTGVYGNTSEECDNFQTVWRVEGKVIVLSDNDL
jgi:hypothetical protein